MKKLLLLTFSLTLFSTLAAQNEHVVISQNKCHLQFEDDMTEWWQENFKPILNDLVKEGHLINWGVLTHAWGDEWNWNVYYVAESSEKFYEAWGELVTRLSEKIPDFGEAVGKFCFEHKDSMYTHVMGYYAEEEGE